MASTHRYTTTTRWTGTTSVGYDAYERAHEASAPPAATQLKLSGDQAFRGDATKLNPEQLLVLAASSCQLLSFLAVAARARVDVVAYEDDAVGEMPDEPQPRSRPQRVARITLSPRITILGELPSGTRLLHLVEVAHRECFIANSLASEIEIRPTFLRAPA